MVFMEQTEPKFYDILSIEQFSDCFDTTFIETDYPIQIVSTGLKDILVPIKTEEMLHDLQPDFSEIQNLSDEYSVVGMHLYTFNNNRIICRILRLVLILMRKQQRVLQIVP